MPHNLSIQDGQASMMYVGPMPWHQLGTKLKHPPTSAEAIEAAKLNWQVQKEPLYMGYGDFQRIRRQYAVVPSDRWGKADCPVFGFVGAEYVPLQNKEAFAFFDPVVKRGQASYETAGALGKGERVWILAKMTDNITIKGRDEVSKYLLLFNSHDGRNCVQIKFTPIRVVCQNTLLKALSSGNFVRIAHTRSMAKHLEDAKELLGLINDEFAQIEEIFQRMAEVALNGYEVISYMSKVFPLPNDDGDEAAHKRISQHREDALNLFESGYGNREQGISGTLWAAYNGVAQLVDHKLIARRSPSRQAESISFGDGAQIKLRALAVADQFMDRAVGRN